MVKSYVYSVKKKKRQLFQMFNTQKSSNYKIRCNDSLVSKILKTYDIVESTYLCNVLIIDLHNELFF